MGGTLFGKARASQNERSKNEINIGHIDDTHFFTLSQVYEDLLLKMGE
jgi:hypothetical protein